MEQKYIDKIRHSNGDTFELVDLLEYYKVASKFVIPTNNTEKMNKLMCALHELGCRECKLEPIKLHSGKVSDVFWNIEKLRNYSLWIQEEALKSFTWEVGKLKPQQLVGIRSGGYSVANVIGDVLDVDVIDEHWCPRREGVVLVDDVLTTGSTIIELLKMLEYAGKVYGTLYKPDYIAVLVNRSNILGIKGIPVISGCFADKLY